MLSAHRCSGIFNFKSTVYVPIQKHLCPLPSANSSDRDTGAHSVPGQSTERNSRTLSLDGLGTARELVYVIPAYS